MLHTDNFMSKPTQKMNGNGSGSGGNSRLLILLLSLGIYVVTTSGIVTQLSKGSAIPSTTQRTLDLQWRREAEVKNSVTEGASNQEYTCDAQNSPDFLPGGNLITRSLHGVIIGAMKSGTQALHTILLTHPRVLTTGKGHGELHFFNDRGRGGRGMNRHVPQGSSSRRSTREGGSRQEEGGRRNRRRRGAREQRKITIPRQDIRDAFELVLEGRADNRDNGTHDIVNDQNKNKVAIHSAPIYLFSGRIVPARLLCVAPWSKVLAILRNPIDRAFSHYNYWNLWGGPYNGVRPSFERFISDDIKLLKSTGVIRDWNRTNFESFSRSPEEMQSWENYIKESRGQGPVGRGLYAIQLDIWIDEFKKVNKSVENDLLVLQSEETKKNTHDAYERTVQFLGLEPGTDKRHVIEKDHHPTHYISHNGISNEAYKLLYDIYEPYNKRLYTLLGESDWGGVWDDTQTIKQ
mmetsp:Transcript_43353/g.77928  ORF Transcript_43353/g.77928 Transcript_43353/m.77928 type:complete len:462 (-) Transcript_43353:12-1397(-)